MCTDTAQYLRNRLKADSVVIQIADTNQEF